MLKRPQTLVAIALAVLCFFPRPSFALTGREVGLIKEYDALRRELSETVRAIDNREKIQALEKRLDYLTRVLDRIDRLKAERNVAEIGVDEVAAVEESETLKAALQKADGEEKKAMSERLMLIEKRLKGPGRD